MGLLVCGGFEGMVFGFSWAGFYALGCSMGGVLCLRLIWTFGCFMRFAAAWRVRLRAALHGENSYNQC